MKRIFLLFVSVVCLSAAQAQVKFGVKAGLNMANLTGDYDGSMKMGLNLGAFARISVSEAFSIQPELVLSGQGAKSEMEIEDEVMVTVKQKLSYLNIPIMAQYHAGDFIIGTGPQIGFLMSAKSKVAGSWGALGGDNKEFFKGIDFSWALGVGYETKSGFGINARYNLGLSNISKNDHEEPEEEEVKVKNSVIQVGVSWTFGKK